MKRPRLLSLFLLAALPFSPALSAQELDGSDVQRELIQREERVNKLPVEDQLKLRAAQQKAAQDPEVQAALQKRNQAIREFRAAVRAAILKADPTVAPLLDAVAIKDSAPAATPSPR